MKKLTAMLLALMMVISLAACSSEDPGNSSNPGNDPSVNNPDDGQGATGKQDDIVLWTLSNDL